jgi:hypothetical protein
MHPVLRPPIGSRDRGPTRYSAFCLALGGTLEGRSMPWRHSRRTMEEVDDRDKAASVARPGIFCFQGSGFSSSFAIAIVGLFLTFDGTAWIRTAAHIGAPLMSVAVIGVTILALPDHLFRSRGFRQGGPCHTDFHLGFDWLGLHGLSWATGGGGDANSTIGSGDRGG